MIFIQNQNQLDFISVIYVLSNKPEIKKCVNNFHKGNGPFCSRYANRYITVTALP